jgi:hypothetical protein
MSWYVMPLISAATKFAATAAKQDEGHQNANDSNEPWLNLTSTIWNRNESVSSTSSYMYKNV